MFTCPKDFHEYRKPIQGDYGNDQNGFIVLRHKGLAIQFSNGDGWEHVSVSRKSKMPTYEHMCWVKDQFWGADACVMQLHVPRSDHVNVHEYCLHLWRPIDAEIPRPPAYMVG